MSSNLYIKSFANPHYREDLDEDTVSILYDTWWDQGEDLGEVNYRTFWGSMWRASGLISLEEWLGAPEKELRKGTLKIEQFLPRISQGVANALRGDKSVYFNTVKADGFLSDYEEYRDDPLIFAKVHPQNKWDAFLEEILLQCHKHSDWYIYLD